MNKFLSGIAVLLLMISMTSVKAMSPLDCDTKTIFSPNAIEGTISREIANDSSPVIIEKTIKILDQ